MHLLALWPWPLNPKTVSLLGYTKVIPYTKFEHCGIIRFVFLNCAADKQTDKQTDSKIMGNEKKIVQKTLYRFCMVLVFVIYFMISDKKDVLFPILYFSLSIFFKF